MTLKKLDQSSVEWARLETAERCSVGAFIDNLPKQEAAAMKDKRYLFDWSIPLNCPRLAEEVKIPKYFAGQFDFSVRRVSVWSTTCYPPNQGILFSLCLSVCLSETLCAVFVRLTPPRVLSAHKRNLYHMKALDE